MSLANPRSLRVQPGPKWVIESFKAKDSTDHFEKVTKLPSWFSCTTTLALHRDPCYWERVEIIEFATYFLSTQHYNFIGATTARRR